MRVVLKFDRIRASDAGNYICRGTATSPSNSIIIQLATAKILTDNPYNYSTQVSQQFLSNNSIYPNDTSFVLTLGESHTFRCPSEAMFNGNPSYTVITRWFRDGCVVSNDSYHHSFHDGRLLVQSDPNPGLYVCKGYLPIPGYPDVVLMRATLSVVSPPPPTTPAPTIAPIVYALPIGQCLSVFPFAFCFLTRFNSPVIDSYYTYKFIVL